MSVLVCEACGQENPAEARFCQRCHAFLGWDATQIGLAASARTDASPTSGPTTTADGQRSSEAAIGAQEMPRVVDRTATAPSSTAFQPTTRPAVDPQKVLRVEAPSSDVVVALDGSSSELVLQVRNCSDIVDGYEVDVSGAPVWLKVEAQPLRLLPDSTEPLAVRFRLVSESLVPAGQGTVRLRVRSLTQAPASQIVAVTVTVPVVEAPVAMRTEPRVVRVRDVDTARFVVNLDNSASNRTARLRLAGTDPELAVGFHFDPAELALGPGESARIRVVTTSPRPEPGAELTRSLTVSAIEGKRSVDAVVTLLQATSAVVEDPVVELAATPSLIRLRDAETTTLRVSVDNRAGRQWATLRLEAADPEHVVVAGWETSEIRVPPGRTSEVGLRLTAPLPEPGTEVSRAVTLTAADGRRVARSQVTLVQTASASPMTTLAVHLDPSVVRLPNRRRGSASVFVDNRHGQAPIRVSLRGDDPENTVAFTFTPAVLDVPAGQSVGSRVAFSAPRAPGGREITRSFTVAASDGRSAATACGTLIQSASDRRPWVRVLLTIAGGLAILLGVMLPFAGRVVTALGLDDDALEQALNVELGDLPALVSVGVLLMVLAGLMVFGLTGRSGRLTRWSALLAAAVLVAAAVIFSRFGLESGVIVIGLGCVLGYIGGLLVRR